jgi:kynurenine formamidase
MSGKRAAVDLSHAVEHGMITYPGLPGPEIVDHLSREQSRERYAPGTEFQIGRITLVANTGTYLDAPFHRFAEGADLSELTLSGLVDLAGFLVDAADLVSAVRGIGPGLIEDALAGRADEVAGGAVLVRTGWDRHWGTERYGDPAHPFLTADAIRALLAYRPAVVGIDSVNIDDMADPTRPAHTGLLGAGIPVVEHMTGLGALPPEGFAFHAAPVGVVGMGTFPVRAYALIDVG